MLHTPFDRFIGLWVLDPNSCDYEQGEPPQSGTYRIAPDGVEVVITMAWVDAEGEQTMTFRGVPDGKPVRFDAGPLADSLAIAAVADDRLDSAAYRAGVELMTAKRTLSKDGASMTVVQTVHLPDGTAPTNTAVYRKAN